MSDSCEQFSELENSIAETVRQAQQKLRINARTQELLRVDGATYNYSSEQAREQATIDVLGASARHEDTS